MEETNKSKSTGKLGQSSEMDMTQKQQESENDKTWPKVLECRECGQRIKGQCDAFIITCCEPDLICDRCIQQRRGMVRCGTCKKTAKPTKIKRKFFGSIERAFTGDSLRAQARENGSQSDAL